MAYGQVRSVTPVRPEGATPIAGQFCEANDNMDLAENFPGSNMSLLATLLGRLRPSLSGKIAGDVDRALTAGNAAEWLAVVDPERSAERPGAATTWYRN